MTKSTTTSDNNRKKKQKNTHTYRENENTEVQKKCRKQRKAGKVQQVIDGGGIQVGTCERPGRCQPSPLRKRCKSILIKYSKYAQVYQYRAIPAALAHKGIIDPNNVDETDKGPKY